MKKSIGIILAFLICSLYVAPATSPVRDDLRAGASAIPITPFGSNPDWDGTVTASGVWGEKFSDGNKNGRWDPGEPFEDDPGNTAMDPSSADKYDGIYLAGFGNNRLATGKHDDLWVRALVLESGNTRIALVTLDVIGYYSRADYYGLSEIQNLLDKKLHLDEVLISSTHSHEGPDSIGAWGVNRLSDGKYPKYLRFVDRQVAAAITNAAKSLVPVRMKAGRTDSQQSPSIAGMQTRTGGRPPRFFDDELRVLQFIGQRGDSKDRTIATLVNWNTHPESMEDQNTLLTSDFPHALRQSIESRFGGTALYFSGDLGAAEIIGDTAHEKDQRINFDGKDYPLAGRAKNEAFTFERTEAIGRDMAKAATNALGKAEWIAVSSVDVKKAELRAPMDNKGYTLLIRSGVFDMMTMPQEGDVPALRTWVYLLTLGDVQIVTSPGELFPEVFYGVEAHRRSDCPQADTGRAPELAVRDRMKAKYRLIFGLCPDEFGYLVPGYDFMPPAFDSSIPEIRETEDPCKSAGVPAHYHETNSASSSLAPSWACLAAALAEGKPPTSLCGEN
jgi:hypothetical protein